ncbi:hypothetical protein L484_014279 [Morus notabilis]|uniref:Uncharacterized protein n=1 Tax=Morus notabilis TaxID=981085 RepID=W9RN23_9ROSA|nr:hypothetical protein L484_014279 [Morus notabilis]
MPQVHRKHHASRIIRNPKASISGNEHPTLRLPEPSTATTTMPHPSTVRTTHETQATIARAGSQMTS